jgi:hypothetical protein
MTAKKTIPTVKRRNRALGWLNRALTWARGPGLMFAVAGDAFGGSYGHIDELLNRWGQKGWHGYTSAGLVDTLCVVGMEYYRKDKRTRAERHGLGKLISYPAFLFVSGVAVSMFGNWATASGPLVNHLAAAWPSYVLLLILGLAEWDKSRTAEIKARTPDSDPAGLPSRTRRTRTPDSDQSGSGNPVGPGENPGVGDDRTPDKPLPSPVPPRPEVIIPAGFKIPPGPLSADQEMGYVRRAVAALIDANPALGRRPRLEEIARTCGRRKADLAARVRQLADADYTGTTAATPAREAVDA